MNRLALFRTRSRLSARSLGQRFSYQLIKLIYALQSALTVRTPRLQRRGYDVGVAVHSFNRYMYCYTHIEHVEQLRTENNYLHSPAPACEKPTAISRRQILDTTKRL